MKEDVDMMALHTPGFYYCFTLWRREKDAGINQWKTCAIAFCPVSMLLHDVITPLLALADLMVPAFFWHLSGCEDWKQGLILCVIAAAFAVMMSLRLTQLVLTLEVADAVIRIRTPFRQHAIPFGTLKALSQSNERGFLTLFNADNARRGSMRFTCSACRFGSA